MGTSSLDQPEAARCTPQLGVAVFAIAPFSLYFSENSFHFSHCVKRPKPRRFPSDRRTC